jgi:hypothetical protein
MTLGAGIHTISAERYHADPTDAPALSAHIAHLLVNSTPLHAWAAHPKLNPDFERKEKAVYDVGTVAHALVLEGNNDKVHVIDAADWRTKHAKGERDEARRNGLVPLLERDWAHVQAMTEAVRMQLAARDDKPPLFSDGKPEQSLIWQDGPVVCRARLDWLRDDFAAIDDLKTTKGTANPIKWSRNTLWDIGADIQVAFYRRGVKNLTGVDPQFRYVIAETTPPYATSVIQLGSSALELGRIKVERALELWAHCLKHDRWPGYPAPVYFAETPAYEEMRWTEQDAERLAA